MPYNIIRSRASAPHGTKGCAYELMSSQLARNWKTCPQAPVKKTRAKYNPLWQGEHAETKAKLYITTRQDHYELMVLYEANKLILSQRIDHCGVHSLVDVMDILVAAPMSAPHPPPRRGV